MSASPNPVKFIGFDTPTILPAPPCHGCHEPLTKVCRVAWDVTVRDRMELVGPTWQFGAFNCDYDGQVRYECDLCGEWLVDEEVEALGLS